LRLKKAIVPAIKRFKDHVNFNIYFIAEENVEESHEEPLKSFVESIKIVYTQNTKRCHGRTAATGGKFRSLHGKSEIDEDIRQVVMAKYYPEKYLDYLVIRSENYTTDN
jgi:hypothetical protein